MWVFWVSGHALWLDKCPLYIPEFDEPSFLTFFEEVYLGYFDDILIYSHTMQDHLVHF